jgi:hypothetical protein
MRWCPGLLFEKHGFVPFFLGNLRLLVVRVASCHAILWSRLRICALGIRRGVAHAMVPGL